MTEILRPSIPFCTVDVNHACRTFTCLSITPPSKKFNSIYVNYIDAYMYIYRYIQTYYTYTLYIIIYIIFGYIRKAKHLLQRATTFDTEWNGRPVIFISDPCIFKDTEQRHWCPGQILHSPEPWMMAEKGWQDKVLYTVPGAVSWGVS